MIILLQNIHMHKHTVEQQLATRIVRFSPNDDRINELDRIEANFVGNRTNSAVFDVEQVILINI